MSRGMSVEESDKQERNGSGWVRASSWAFFSES